MTTRIFLTLLATLAACSQNHPIGAFQPDAFQPDAFQPDAVRVLTPGNLDGGGIDAVSLAIDTGPLGPVQSWTGWLENAHLQSGSDVIKLQFASDPDGVVVGQITFGVGAPPPPATDPNVGYPNPDGNSYQIALEGFPFTIYQGIFTTNRLRFSYQPHEPWAGWCALQPPLFDGSETCAAAWRNDSCALYCPTQGTFFVNCGKMQLFGNCLCSATGCRLKLPTDSRDPVGDELAVPVDIAFSGDTAAGSMKDLNLRLTKDP